MIIERVSGREPSEFEMRISQEDSMIDHTNILRYYVHRSHCIKYVVIVGLGSRVIK